MLLLFDIDGTLLRKAHTEHREALHAAIKRVWGVDDPAATRVEAAGRTDLEITRQILLASGVGARRIDDRMLAFREAVVREYARRVPADLSERVARGVPELLDRLAGRDRVILSLVTGNLEPIARLKLRAAGIGGYFAVDQGGFGSDAEDRAELPGIARARAGRHAGLREPYPRERTVVIGDTPRDIACAQADGVRCLAVAGGPYRVEDLRGADAVARDVHALGPLLDELL
jgi:phosphoglycolate phosphatase